MTTLFGEPIYTYTRAQAIADGGQFAVPSQTSLEAGLSYPVFLTRAVFDCYVAVPASVTAQDEAGRLWDILWMLRFAIQQSGSGAHLPFALYVRNDAHRATLVQLLAVSNWWTGPGSKEHSGLTTRSQTTSWLGTSKTAA